MTEHKYHELNFAGAAKRACVYCHCLDDSPQAKEPCPQGSITETEAAKPKSPAKFANASDIVKSLDSESIERRIEEVEGELAALKVLLKAAQAKEAGRKKVEP